ncbi:8-oxo-dGTP diphosphatase MutT [Neptunicella sp. SCSIO 80796]|uniref:8-oxo-dGTP diphosphatase MutT n=1 Tax=Neptunicella plasticusilytica TaxID=3117012 RepID=UPI003A4D9373
MKVVEVAVGVIKRDNTIFITKRADNLHQGGKWEFPGGKKERNESISQALGRELQEEIGIETISHQPMMVIEHHYGDKQVRLDVHLVDEFDGEPYGKEGQQGKWVPINQLDEYEFPAANQQILTYIQKL